jgi:hypothetical protein
MNTPHLPCARRQTLRRPLIALALTGAVTASTMAWAADTDGDGIPDDQEVALSRNPAYKDNDVFVDASLFAKQQFRDFFGREADAASASYWAGTLTPGNDSRASLAATFLASSEYGNSTGAMVRLYAAAFARIPDYTGLAFWVAEYQKNASQANLVSIAQQFAQSTEFSNTYGTLNNSGYVARLYLNILGRAGDASGAAYWTAQLDAGMSRGALLAAFSESTEYKATTANSARVIGAFAAMARRAPSTSEYNSWVASLNGSGTPAQLAASIIAATEYRTRFLPALNTGEYTLDNCTTNIASNAPEFFKRYFRCVTITMNGSDIVITGNSRPPYRSAYYSTSDANYGAFNTARGTEYRLNPNRIPATTQNYSLTVIGNPVSRGLVINSSLVDVQAGTSTNEYRGTVMGMAPNGILQFHGVAAPGDQITAELYTFDDGGGHPNTTGYHYHGVARGALEALAKGGHTASTAPGQADIELYGIMCDGTLVLGCKGLDGVAPDPTTLDAQNGKVSDIRAKDGTLLFASRYHVYACSSLAGKSRVLTPEIQYYSQCR